MDKPDIMYRNIPVHTWTADGSGNVALRLLKLNPAYTRVMEAVGKLMEQGAEVHLTHRIVRSSYYHDKAYDVIDIDIKRPGIK